MKPFSRTLFVASTLVWSMLSAHAAEVSGVKFDETATVAGKPLVLNGLGVRYKVVKVYALGLYLSDKKSSTADVLALTTPKRFRIVTLREITSEELGQAFLTGINKNLSKDEKGKFVNQLVKFGELFNEIEGGKKGDVIAQQGLALAGPGGHDADRGERRDQAAERGRPAGCDGHDTPAAAELTIDG